MQLEELQKHWNAFAKPGPFWAILTAPGKENGQWSPKSSSRRANWKSMG
jgi:hypothetical protein